MGTRIAPTLTRLSLNGWRSLTRRRQILKWSHLPPRLSTLDQVATRFYLSLQLVRSISHTSSDHANHSKAPASSIEPSEHESRKLIEQGSSLLEKGDIQGALDKYKKSILVRPTPTGYYNLGIALYQLKKIPEAIDSWNKSLAEFPSADVHTNLASAYILSKPPQPFKALEHLKKAVELDPTDGEIRFNLGAVNEANDHLAEALAEYTQARQLGVQRAEQNIRNVGAKLLRKRLEEENVTKSKEK